MMAIRDFNEAKKIRKGPKLHKTQIIIMAAIVVLFSITVFACIIPNYAGAASYNQQAQQLSAQIDALDAQSEKISRSLEDTDSLFEKIAREEYGYCKPGERVFYSSSFGE